MLLLHKANRQVFVDFGCTHPIDGLFCDYILLLHKANGQVFVDFGCTHPIDGLF
jgi:hypothetical protein